MTSYADHCQLWDEVEGNGQTPTAYFCGVPGCGLPQTKTPSGYICANRGHGGALSLLKEDLPKVFASDKITPVMRRLMERQKKRDEA